ncbi:YciI family protein [Psychromicrobium xiongbiense]|uniref:YciI family protein n=1 Tax=Psychromicrobium xiongbiense TaxID=3051184 RepID=UPI002554396D|nr:YciI family protein [Psychromicrobium sp. YIM S02556]
MRYMLLMHYSEREGQNVSEEAIAAAKVAFASYAAALEAAGALIAAEVLHGSESSTTVSLIDGGLRIQDGPFADTKEQLGGVFLIEVADLDAALDWAQQAPPIRWGAVEIRPVATHTVAGIWAT